MQKTRIQSAIRYGLILWITSCSSGAPGDRPGTLAREADGRVVATLPVPLQSVPNSDSLAGDVDSTVLALVPDTGSSMRFLDARGLTRYYQNVFTKKDFGFMHCEKTKPANPSDCTDSIFSMAERPAMGSFDLGSPRMNRAPQNVNPATSLTLNYTRTLRAALSRECISLVDAEIIKFKAKDTASNLLVLGEKPLVADLNEFMRKLLGLGGTTLPIAIDAESYAAAFEQLIRAAKDKNVGMRNGYIGVCIALSMDPLVFIY